MTLKWDVHSHAEADFQSGNLLWCKGRRTGCARDAQRKGPGRSQALESVGGDEEDRTPDLCIANAALSQLSYAPTKPKILSGHDEYFGPKRGVRGPFRTG